MSQDREPGWQGPDDDVGSDPAALDAQRADLVAYCRAVTGREEDALATAQAVLDSAHSLLSDPDQLRAWLFALARIEILAGSEPQAREIFDLVHRHGILPQDLPVVLGIPPAEADQLLAAAEAEYGDDEGRDIPGGDDTTQRIEGQPDLPAAASPGEMLDAQLSYLVAYCSALTGREQDAVKTAHSVLSSSRSLLTDPDRLRAWLFALARREMLADAAPGEQEIRDLIHQHGIRAEDLSTVLGVPLAEAAQLLAAAEEESASSAPSSGHREADSRDAESSADEKSWDDRAAAWDSIAELDDGTEWDDSPDRDDSPDGDEDTDGDGDADWDETFGPKRHGLQDVYGVFRKPPEPAGRHAAPTFVSGLRQAGGLRQALARGPIRVAAATAIVVAVIGVSAAYLAASNSPPSSPAGQQTTRRPAAEAQSPVTSPNPAATVTPTLSPGPSRPVTVVLPPQPAPTSPRPSPKPSPKPSPPPSPSPSPSPSSSPSPSPL